MMPLPDEIRKTQGRDIIAHVRSAIIDVDADKRGLNRSFLERGVPVHPEVLDCADALHAADMLLEFFAHHPREPITGIKASNIMREALVTARAQRAANGSAEPSDTENDDQSRDRAQDSPDV